jgi:penicillin-binding protein 2
MFSRRSFRRYVYHFVSKRSGEIAPDEIFLDAYNLPEFNTHQFEGRLEKPISKTSIIILSVSFLLIGFIFIGQVWNLQIRKGEAYSMASERNRLHHTLVFAERGVVYDRNGVELAWNVPNEGEAFARRRYKDEPGLAHLVGYVNYPSKDNAGFYYREDFVGKDGAEKSYNEWLSGKNGLKIVETNALGDMESESTIFVPKDGKNLTLSVDSRLQSRLYKYMEETAEAVGFSGGAGAVMDVDSGELLALVSYPEYSSEVLTNNNDAEAIRRYREDEKKPFLNRAVSGLYTPGSTVKPFIAIGALNEKIISPGETIISTGSISITNPYFPDQKTIFRDWKAHGPVDMRKAIAVSSNVYFYEIGGGYKGREGLGIARIEKYMRLFGFGQKVGITLSTEQEGIIPTPAWKAEHFKDGTWRVGDTYNTVIGQYGVQVTPLQEVRAVAAIANKGKLFTPTIVKLKEKSQPSFIKIPVDQEYFKVVQEGMRQAVLSGTAKGLHIPQVAVAAKTGTAQIGITKKRVHSWVIGFFPYDHPRYAFAVIMEKGPSENLTGALYVFRRLLEWMAVYTPEYLQ